eukprot:5843371-Karenia_brevis.AAC.1
MDQRQKPKIMRIMTMSWSSKRRLTVRVTTTMMVKDFQMNLVKSLFHLIQLRSMTRTRPHFCQHGQAVTVTCGASFKQPGKGEIKK